MSLTFHPFPANVHLFNVCYRDIQNSEFYVNADDYYHKYEAYKTVSRLAFSHSRDVRDALKSAARSYADDRFFSHESLAADLVSFRPVQSNNVLGYYWNDDEGAFDNEGFLNFCRDGFYCDEIYAYRVVCDNGEVLFFSDKQNAVFNELDQIVEDLKAACVLDVELLCGMDSVSYVDIH